MVIENSVRGLVDGNLAGIYFASVTEHDDLGCDYFVWCVDFMERVGLGRDFLLWRINLVREIVVDSMNDFVLERISLMR